MKSKEITKAKSPDIERKEEKERERETGFTLRDFKNNIEDFEIREVLGILIYNMKNILGKLFLGQGSYASVRLGVLKETKKKLFVFGKRNSRKVKLKNKKKYQKNKWKN